MTITTNHSLVGTSRIKVEIWEPTTGIDHYVNGERVVDWKIFDEGQSIEDAQKWGQNQLDEDYQWIKLTVQEWREQVYKSSLRGPVVDAELVDIKGQEGYSNTDNSYTWYDRPVSEL